MQRMLLALLVSSLLAVSNALSSSAKSTATVPTKSAQHTTPGKSAVTGFVAVGTDINFPLPKIVLQFDPVTETGYDWEKLKDLGFYQLSGSNSTVVHTIRYLREAVQRMTGKELPVVSGNDLTRGIVITTLAGAPADLKKNPEVLRALRNNGKDSYNANEAFFIRTEPQRVVIVTNTVQGFPVAVVELLESVGYEVLGMGPNWTHVPDYTNKPLTFALRRAGRAGFYIRQFGAASGQPGGIGTLFLKPLPAPTDETVEVSYQRWLMGTRMASRSMPDYPGHALQEYHRPVIEKMRETRSPAGFLTTVTIGPDAQRPAATEENSWHLWINDDAAGQPGAGKVFMSYNKAWSQAQSGYVPASLDLSVPMVREIILQDMKQKAQAHFEKSPNEIFVLGTDPEDGGAYAQVGERLHNKNWYPEYLAQEGVKFPQPYVLHGFKGLNQPQEMWDSTFASDTVFGFNNWLLREFDQWIDSLPAEQRVTKTGRPKKELVRTSLYSYNAHDVPANFNLDPRIRVMIAGFPIHRGQGKWRNFATPFDMAQAFQKQLPREPSGDYWIMSIALYNDTTTAAIGNFSKLPATLQRQMQEQYAVGFRAISAEMDFNFGRLGLDYYLYTKLLWNPQLTVAEVDAIRDRWLQRAFGSGWREMKSYYDLMAPESKTVNASNKWGRAIRIMDAAAARIDAAREPAAQRRLDDLKQFWYFYYLLESGQGKSDSRAMREFLWKGQMSYMTAMHAVATNIFKTSDVRAAVGPEFNTGPAHYTHAETQAWWAKILDFWKVTPVSEFAEATLANGRRGKEVDLNDLVMVQELRSEKPTDMYFYYETEAYPASILTVATKPGEEIGFKLNWPGKPKDVTYGVSRWDAKAKRWEDLVDIATARKASVPFTKDGFQMQLVEIRYKAPNAGTYRFDVGQGGGTGAKLTSLAYDESTDTYGSTLPFSFYTNAVGYTQSPAYFYIPKGTKNLDFEVWGPPAGKELQLNTGLPGAGMKPSRKITLTKQGTQRVALNPGEDGSIALIYGDLFNMPQLYSVPQIWAKSPDVLLMPRAIAEADRLKVVQGP